jgi:hypothetical protein
MHIYTYVCRLKLALTSPTSGGRSVGIVRSRTRPWSKKVYIYIYNERILLNEVYIANVELF